MAGLDIPGAADHNSAHRYLPSILKWTGLLLTALLVGHICWETLLAAYDWGHFQKLVEHNEHILQGHADIYAFQQRILPSLFMKCISGLLHVDFSVANYLFYRAMFVGISVAFVLMCQAAGLSARRTVPLLLLFSAANMFMPIGGFWLYANDLQNEIFILLLFALFISDMGAAFKFALFSAMAVVWQFTFEEVIYIPMIYLISLNIADLMKFKLKAIAARAQNWLLAGAGLLSIWATSFTRAYLYKGGGVTQPGSIFGQWIMLSQNFSTIRRQVRAILDITNTLRDGYWWAQGAGVFFVMIVCGACMAPSRAELKDIRALSVFLMFFVISLITFLFAHIEEQNAIMPMLPALFAIYLARYKAAQDKAHDAGIIGSH